MERFEDESCYTIWQVYVKSNGSIRFAFLQLHFLNCKMG